MVLGLDLFISLFSNLAVFIALVSLYRSFSKQKPKESWVRRQFVLGLIFGAFAVICMHAKIPVSPGVIVDQRNAIVALGGAFSGPLAAIISATCAGSYRLYLGGEGALAGFIGVFLAATSGIVLYAYKDSFTTLPRAIFSSVFVVFVVLPGFLFYKDFVTGLALLKAMLLPYGLAIFFGVLLVGMLLRREEERYAMELVHRDTERKYRDLVENTFDLVGSVDAKGKYTYVNHMSESILGLAPEECLGVSAIDHIYAEDKERVKKWFYECVEAKTLRDKLEVRMVNVCSGNVTDVMWSASFHYDDEGVFIGGGGIARDMTKRKRAEEAMRHEIARRKALMDIARDGIAIINQQHKVVDANKSFANMLGYTMEEILSLHSWDWDAKHTEEEIRRDFSDMHSANLTFETRHRRKDGTEYDAEIGVSGVLIDEESFVFTVTRDVTERNRTQEYLMQTEKMMSVGGLAAGIAHEINNPLACISGGAQNLKRRLFEEIAVNVSVAEECGISFEAVQAYARIRGLPRIFQGIIDAADRASGIVRNLLDFSRKGDNTFVANDLGTLLDGTVGLISSDFDLKKNYDFRSIEIRRDYEADVHCECEAGQIRQVFLNLIKNAVQAMAEKEFNGLKPCITLSIRRGNGMAVVEIEDNGPGLPEDCIKRIFEPFYTTKPPGQGTGLGLSLSYFIITTQHDGRINAVSCPGEWTRFVIELPVVHEA